jgi:glycosyltransferase involved in cell wall biosynthesis
MPGISIVVTAMNEEGCLEPGVESVTRAASARFSDYEFIIVDDGSTDGTGEVADRLAARDARIRVYHTPVNRGLHDAYLRGIKLATKEYICWVAGNNMITAADLGGVFDAMGSADVVLSYPRVDKRVKYRVFISRSIILLLNTLFALRLRYYAGPCVYRASLAKELRSVTRGWMAVPEIVIRLLKSGQSYVEVPLDPQKRMAGRTKMFRLRNVAGSLASVLTLFIDIHRKGSALPVLPGDRIASARRE